MMRTTSPSTDPNETEEVPTPCDSVPKPMTVYEESVLLSHLDNIFHPLSKSKPDLNEVGKKDLILMRRLRRKLAVRRAQRRHGQDVFDLDEVITQIQTGQDDSIPVWAQSVFKRARINNKGSASALDRCQAEIFQTEVERAFIIPQPTSRPLVSHYTERHLKKFIRRDFELTPPKLKLHFELLNKHSEDPIVRHPIDFCYIQRHHVPSVNAMASEFFWPGIDVSESLEHPDFSVVALYRQLLIGFALMIPNISHTEAYVTFIFVHPDWRKCGIGKFFIYHLIQSCSGKDIVLHVSVNNPAVFLYQSFGFKVEGWIAGFYEKYLPYDSSECKDALFLRLSR